MDASLPGTTDSGPYTERSTITLFFFTLLGVSMLVAPVSSVLKAHQHPAQQTTAVCDYFADDSTIDPTTIGCAP